MIFSSLEKAKNAVKILRKRHALGDEELNIEDVNKEILIYKEHYRITRRSRVWS